MPRRRAGAPRATCFRSGSAPIGPIRVARPSTWCTRAERPGITGRVRFLPVSNSVPRPDRHRRRWRLGRLQRAACLGERRPGPVSHRPTVPSSASFRSTQWSSCASTHSPARRRPVRLHRQDWIQHRLLQREPSAPARQRPKPRFRLGGPARARAQLHQCAPRQCARCGLGHQQLVLLFRARRLRREQPRAGGRQALFHRWRRPDFLRPSGRRRCGGAIERVAWAVETRQLDLDEREAVGRGGLACL